MATYMVLGRLSDQGIRGVKDTTKRADAAKEPAKKMGRHHEGGFLDHRPV